MDPLKLPMPPPAFFPMLNQTCPGFLMPFQGLLPQGNPEEYFREECRRLDVQNFALRRTLETLREECAYLREQVAELESPELKAIKKKLKKRKRRVAAEIPRHFTCSICQKSYGSEGSLNQHVKLKHESPADTSAASR